MQDLLARAGQLLRAFGAAPGRPTAGSSLPFVLEGRAGVVMVVGVETDWQLAQRVSLAVGEAMNDRSARARRHGGPAGF